MSMLRWIGLLGLLPVLAACASEGGVVGSGISAVSGNVAEVEVTETVSERGAVAATRLPFAVTVSVIEAPGVAATTDADGTFEVVGDFSGPITLRFAKAEGDAELGTLGLNVPAGSTIVLEDIRIVAKRVLARVARQRDFFGRVELVDCDAGEAGILLVNDSAAVKENHQFMVEIQSDTVITGGRGQRITCAGIRQGDRALIEGRIRVAVPDPDWVIVADEVRVSPPARSQP